MIRKGKERNVKWPNSIVWLGSPNEKSLSIGKVHSAKIPPKIEGKGYSISSRFLIALKYPLELCSLMHEQRRKRQTLKQREKRLDTKKLLLLFYQLKCPEKD